jgi:hypothetical protein
VQLQHAQRTSIREDHQSTLESPRQKQEALTSAAIGSFYTSVIDLLVCYTVSSPDDAAIKSAVWPISTSKEGGVVGGGTVIRNGTTIITTTGAKDKSVNPNNSNNNNNSNSSNNSNNSNINDNIESIGLLKMKGKSCGLSVRLLSEITQYYRTAFAFYGGALALPDYTSARKEGKESEGEIVEGEGTKGEGGEGPGTERVNKVQETGDLEPLCTFACHAFDYLPAVMDRLSLLMKAKKDSATAEYR